MFSHSSRAPSLQITSQYDGRVNRLSYPLDGTNTTIQQPIKVYFKLAETTLLRDTPQVGSLSPLPSPRQTNPGPSALSINPALTSTLASRAGGLVGREKAGLDDKWHIGSQGGDGSQWRERRAAVSHRARRSLPHGAASQSGHSVPLLGSEATRQQGSTYADHHHKASRERRAAGVWVRRGCRCSRVTSLLPNSSMHVLTSRHLHCWIFDFENSSS